MNLTIFNLIVSAIRARLMMTSKKSTKFNQSQNFIVFYHQIKIKFKIFQFRIIKFNTVLIILIYIFWYLMFTAKINIIRTSWIYFGTIIHLINFTSNYQSISQERAKNFNADFWINNFDLIFLGINIRQIWIIR